MSASNGVLSGFVNHTKLAFGDPRLHMDKGTQIPKNNFEKVGEKILWAPKALPKFISNGLHNPKVLAVALTAIAMLATSFFFYPISTVLNVYHTLSLLSPLISFWGIKTTLFVLTQLGIVGWGVRTLGRFSNPTLIKAYNKVLQENQSNEAFKGSRKPYRVQNHPSRVHVLRPVVVVTPDGGSQSQMQTQLPIVETLPDGQSPQAQAE